MNAARIIGLAVAILVFALDQASKFAVVHGFGVAHAGTTALGPFIDLALRWNPGISFSFFPQQSAWGVWGLTGFTLVATALLSVWLYRVQTRMAGFGLGVIIGGALGNVWDRAAYGAVVDFLDLHLGDRHFFVFNLADAAINLGVALLILDALLAGRGGRDERAA